MATTPYTGPAWVTPLFTVMLVGIVVIKVLSAVMDTDVEWEDR